MPSPPLFSQWFKKVPSLSFPGLLVAAYALQVAIAVGLTGWIAVGRNQQMLDRLGGQLTAEMSDRLQDDLTDYLNTLQIILQIDRASWRSEQLDLENLATLERYFWDRLQTSPFIHRLAFANETGDYLAIERQGDRFITTFRTPETAPQSYSYLTLQPGDRYERIEEREFDPRRSQWYKTAQQALVQENSPIHPFTASSPRQIEAVMPAYNERGFYGAIALSLSLHPIADRLQHLNRDHIGEVYLFDRHNNPIAANLSDGDLARHQQILPQLSDRSRETSFSLTWMGEKYYVHIIPIPELEWSIAAIVPQSEFRGEMQTSLRLTILLGLGATLGAILFGWILTKSLKFRDNFQDTATEILPPFELTAIPPRSRNISGGKSQPQLEGREPEPPLLSIPAHFGERRETLEHLQRQLDRILLFKHITEDIRASLDLEEIFATAAEQIGKFLGVTRCHLHTYNNSQLTSEETIPLVAEYVVSGYKPCAPLEIPVRGNIHAQKMLARDRAIASSDVYTEPLLKDMEDFCRQMGLKSLMVVRTSYHGEANGAIAVHQCDRFREWTADEIELVESLAATVGIAIAQATLLEQEKQQRLALDRQNRLLQQEIQERLQAEEELRGSRERLTFLVEQTPLGVIEWKPDGEIVAWNSAAEMIFGYSKAEMLGRCGFDLLVPPEIREYVDKIVTDILLQHGGTCSINENCTKDGRIIVCEWHNTKLVDRQGQTIGLASMVVDITDRQQAEANLKEREAKFRAIFENAGIGIGLMGLDRVIRDSNPALQKLLGYTREELSQLKPDEYVHPEDWQSDRVEWEELIAGLRENYKVEKRYLHQDGRTLWVRLTHCAISSQAKETLQERGLREYTF